MIAFTVFVLTVFLFGLFSHRLEKTVFTAPMVFTLIGGLIKISSEPLGQRSETAWELSKVN